MKEIKAIEEVVKRARQTQDYEELRELSAVKDAYERTQEMGNEILTFDDESFWVGVHPEEYLKIVKALKKYGIKEFAVSPNLYIEFAAGLGECGCKLEGFCKIKARTHRTPGGKDSEVVTAIKMSVN